MSRSTRLSTNEYTQGGVAEKNNDEERDKGWTPDGGPEPAEDSGDETDEEMTAPTPLKGKAPAAAKREREETGEEEMAQIKRTKA
jgi:hypothetical protein